MGVTTHPPPLIASPIYSLELKAKLHTEDSGLQLNKNLNGVGKTIAIVSRFLNGSEIKYSTNKREPIGLVISLGHFKNFN